MPTPVRLSYTLRDSEGIEGSECFYGSAADAALVSDVATEWQALATQLDAITDAKIVHGEACIVLNMTGGKGAPTADSRLEEVGIFNFGATGTTRRNGFDVLALSDTVRVTGIPNKIDLANAAVAAFFGALAATGGLVRFTNAYGQPLTVLIDALLAFRKRRGQLQRASFEVAP